MDIARVGFGISFILSFPLMVWEVRQLWHRFYTISRAILSYLPPHTPCGGLYFVPMPGKISVPAPFFFFPPIFGPAGCLQAFMNSY